jgi:hypothetical protein
MDFGFVLCTTEPNSLKLQDKAPSLPFGTILAENTAWPMNLRKGN